MSPGVKRKSIGSRDGTSIVTYPERAGKRFAPLKRHPMERTPPSSVRVKSPELGGGSREESPVINDKGWGFVPPSQPSDGKKSISKKKPISGKKIKSGKSKKSTKTVDEDVSKLNGTIHLPTTGVQQKQKETRSHEDKLPPLPREDVLYEVRKEQQGAVPSPTNPLAVPKNPEYPTWEELPAPGVPVLLTDPSKRIELFDIVEISTDGNHCFDNYGAEFAKVLSSKLAENKIWHLLVAWYWPRHNISSFLRGYHSYLGRRWPKNESPWIGMLGVHYDVVTIESVRSVIPEDRIHTFCPDHLWGGANLKYEILSGDEFQLTPLEQEQFDLNTEEEKFHRMQLLDILLLDKKTFKARMASGRLVEKCRRDNVGKGEMNSGVSTLY